MIRIMVMLAAALWCAIAQADVPRLLNYQGRLTDASGQPVNGSVAIIFRLYSAPVDGTLVHEEVQIVDVGSGVFSALIGSAKPLTAMFDQQYYLALKVGTDPEMMPRQPLASSPYAIRSAIADALADNATVAVTQITGPIDASTLGGHLSTYFAIAGGPIAGSQVTGPLPAATLSTINLSDAKVLGTDGTNLKWQAASTGTVASVGTGKGLTGGPITASGTINLTATQLLPDIQCQTSEIPKWNGSGWACAADETTGVGSNLVLSNPSTATTGNIMKGTNRFISNFGIGNTIVGENAGNFVMTGTHNSAFGHHALQSNSTGSSNTASGKDALLLNTTGTYNTANGSAALVSNFDGGSNTASGAAALFHNTSGSNNTATGFQALNDNKGGNFNTATGQGALFQNVDAIRNTATGAGALFSNKTGFENTATGFQALNDNDSGHNNTADGAASLFNNLDGSQNTAVGWNALGANQHGDWNTAIGHQALAALNKYSTPSSSSVAVGAQALQNSNGDGNTAVGTLSLANNTTGSNNVGIGIGALAGSTAGHGNIAIGYAAGASTIGSGNLYIGSNFFAGDPADNVIRIGGGVISGDVVEPLGGTATFIAGIRGKTTKYADALPVIVDSKGQLGTSNSSRSIKDDIADMSGASTALMQLRPVTFHYKADRNPAGRTLQYGLIAEEVAEVYPGLIARSPEGEIQSVMYQFLPPMLLNEYQKQQRTIQAQAAEIDRQTAQMSTQETRIAELEKSTAEIAALKQDRLEQRARIDALESQAAEIAALKRQMVQMARVHEQAARLATLDAPAGTK